jgi:hypothetical protein
MLFAAADLLPFERARSWLRPSQRPPSVHALAIDETRDASRRKTMTTSETIAALLGPTLIVSAVMVLANLGAMPTLIEQMSKTPMLIVLSGYAAFVPGLAIVYFHNRWTRGWPVLVTLFGCCRWSSA